MKAATLACLLALTGLAGCSLGDEERPRPATGPAREIGELMRELERAIVRGDWQSVCDDVFTAAARRRAGGKDCARLLRSDSAGLRGPRIETLAITVRKRGAEVRVRSRARGQQPLTELIQLRRERGEYRVDSLRDAASSRLGRLRADVAYPSRQPASASRVASKSVLATPPMAGEVAPASR